MSAAVLSNASPLVLSPMWPPSGPVLVASDGMPTSDAAFRVAYQLALRAAVPVEVVSAVEPVAPPLASPELMPPIIEAQLEQEGRRRESVEAQVARITGEHHAWKVHITSGRPVSVVSRTAQELDAMLIIAGMGEHRLLDRLLGTETALKLARGADAPVLIVPQSTERLPRTVLVAVDFSAECVRAASAARPLLENVERVHLVHVRPLGRADLPPEVWSRLDRGYGEAVRAAFERVTEALALGDGIVQTCELRGSAAREILTLARSTGAELIVAGHTHRTRMERLLGGSVATQLVRGAPCAILLAPEAESEALRGPREQVDVTPFDACPIWRAEMLAFGRRNAGRTVEVEILDSDLGGELTARRYRLAWIGHDWREGAVEIVLGDPTRGRAHALHLVRGPCTISLDGDGAGNRESLRVVRPDGCTVIRVLE